MRAVVTNGRGAELGIRRFTLSDMGRLMEIELACFADDAYDELIFTRWFRENPDLFLLSELEGAVAAYILGNLEGSTGYIVSLGVDPPNRRRGIGSRLVAEVLRRLRERGAATVELESRYDNLPSIHFWRTLGFVPFALVPGYYEDGASALKMRLVLEPMNSDPGNDSHSPGMAGAPREM